MDSLLSIVERVIDGKIQRFDFPGIPRTKFFGTEADGKQFWGAGYTTFHREPDGTITRVGKDIFGPGDLYCPIWHMFKLLDGGAGDWRPRFDYNEA